MGGGASKAKKKEASRLATKETPAKPKPDAIWVGTLNCLGEAFNPFEFLSGANFSGCAQLQTAAQALTWETFLETCDTALLASEQPEGGEAALARMRAHCDAGKVLWSFFDEMTLEKDNKLTARRLNLITFAMCPYGDGEAHPQWTLLATWTTEMAALVKAHPDTYGKDANLWLWDLACNCVASAEPAAFTSICEATYLNPSNFENIARCFWEAAVKAAAGRPLVLGLQEWPSEATDKGVAFRNMLKEEFNLKIAVGEDSVAIAYSAGADSELGDAEILDTSYAKEVMQQCLDALEASGEALDKKASKGCLDTTARKIMAVRFPNAKHAGIAAITFLNVHAKEPKTDAAAKLLADYTLKMCTRAAGEGGLHKLMAFVDSNLAKDALASVFKDALDAQGFETTPEPGKHTTAKMRSKLHGQTYDENKCMKLVRAPKDKLVASKGLLTMPGIVPDMENMVGAGLPADTWASDHALTHAVLAVGPDLPAGGMGA